jgi:hypothetical protein
MTVSFDSVQETPLSLKMTTGHGLPKITGTGVRAHLAQKIALEIAACLALTGLGLAQTVYKSFDADANFSSYKTYRLAASEQSERLDSLTDQQIQRAIVSALAAKALTRVDTENADLYVVYEAAVTREQRVDMMTGGGVYGPGWVHGSGWRYGPGWQGNPTAASVPGNVVTVPVGAVAIEMYEVATRQIVWEAIGTKNIDPKAKPDQRERNLTKGIARIFRDYPPKKK